jgi:hypothetical protein
LSDQVAHERALRAQRETVTGVLHVGTLDNATISRIAGRSYLHV